METRPHFAYVTNSEFVGYLRDHGITPTDEESRSVPSGTMHEMISGGEISLGHKDQRSSSTNEGSAK